jgi:hypothetical protein
VTGSFNVRVDVAGKGRIDGCNWLVKRAHQGSRESLQTTMITVNQARAQTRFPVKWPSIMLYYVACSLNVSNIRCSQKMSSYATTDVMLSTLSEKGMLALQLENVIIRHEIGLDYCSH